MTTSNPQKRPKMESRKARSRRRIRLAEIAVTLICVCFVGTFGFKYVVNPILASDSQATKNSIMYNAIEDYVVEGDILDRNGNVVSGNATDGIRATVDTPENYSYAWLLGYYSVTHEQENTFGLRGNLKDYSLYYLDSNNKGATTYLTTDSGLQNYAYQLLDGNEGSITVLDNETGAILALASQSTIDYNVNDTSTLINSDIPESQFRRGTYENDPPGSTFKVVTAAAALKMKEEENLDDSFFQFTDTGSYIPYGSDYVIHNFGDAVFGDVNLESALNNSVNTYFANLGIQVGAQRIHDMAESFQLGKTIEIPFLGTISSQLDTLKQLDNVELAQTAFGQGNTEVTPLNMAMIAQAIANNGDMMQPYIVKSIKSGRLPLYHFFPHKLNTCIDATIDEELKTIMHSTAVGYGFDEYSYGMVYAKTGTAECADGSTHTYIIGFNDQVSFCISMNNGDLSSRLYPVAQRLIRYVNSMNP